MPTSITKQTVALSRATSCAEPHMEDPAWAAWQAHVDAGRIGSKPSRTFEQRLRLMRNEVALFGRVVTPELERF